MASSMGWLTQLIHLPPKRAGAPRTRRAPPRWPPTPRTDRGRGQARRGRGRGGWRWPGGARADTRRRGRNRRSGAPWPSLACRIIGGEAGPRNDAAAPDGPAAGRRGSVALGHEALGEQRLEALLELGGHRVRDLVGRSHSLGPRSVSPTLEVGVLVGRAITHGESVDQVLELLRELTLRRQIAVGRLDHRGDVLPVHDTVARHGDRPILSKRRAIA